MKSNISVSLRPTDSVLSADTFRLSNLPPSFVLVVRNGKVTLLQDPDQVNLRYSREQGMRASVVEAVANPDSSNLEFTLPEQFTIEEVEE